MDRDGTKAGFDLALTRAVSDAVERAGDCLGRRGQRSTTWPMASRSGGADAVLAASIFHYGEFTVAQAKAHMAARGIPVRL
jgi:cyclase